MADKTDEIILPRNPHGNWRRIGNVPESTPGINVVTIVFHGLLSLCFDNRTNVVEVGAFSSAFSSEHQPKIKIRGGSCNGFELAGNDIPANGVTLETVGPGAFAGAYGFEIGDDFDRLSDPPPNEKDLRWVLDFEGPDFYDERITQKYPGYYSPRLKIKNGIFYTLDKTRSTFNRVSLLDPTDIKRLGNIAFCLAANLPFTAGQAVKLTIPGQPFPCTFPYSESTPDYKIYFTNHCNRGGDICADSDFFRHFHSFDPPSGKGRFDLVLDTHGGSGSHHCGGLDESAKKGTDEAPCTSMGYGGSPGTLP